jgi:hypothetical protein
LSFNLCIFKGDRCVVCNAPQINARQICGSWKPGIGDHIAAGLDAIGITKERVAAVLGDCGCEQRQQLLNELGNRIGIGTPPRQPSA